EAADQVAQLWHGLVGTNLVDNLVGHRDERPGRIVGKRRLRHQDQRLAIAQARDDLVSGLPTRELPEIFLDVLDFPRPRLERVLLDQVFHQSEDYTRSESLEVSQRCSGAARASLRAVR